MTYYVSSGTLNSTIPTISTTNKIPGLLPDSLNSSTPLTFQGSGNPDDISRSCTDRQVIRTWFTPVGNVNLQTTAAPNCTQTNLITQCFHLCLSQRFTIHQLLNPLVQLFSSCSVVDHACGVFVYSQTTQATYTQYITHLQSVTCQGHLDQKHDGHIHIQIHICMESREYCSTYSVLYRLMGRLGFRSKG